MNDKNFNIDIEITAKFRVNSAIDRLTLNEYFNGDLKQYVESFLIVDYKLFGVAESEYVVTDVKEI